MRASEKMIEFTDIRVGDVIRETRRAYKSTVTTTREGTVTHVTPHHAYGDNGREGKSVIARNMRTDNDDVVYELIDRPMPVLPKIGTVLKNVYIYDRLVADLMVRTRDGWTVFSNNESYTADEDDFDEGLTAYELVNGLL